MRAIVLLLLLLVGCASDDFQIDPTPDATMPDGLYVPVDLEDAFVELDRMLPSKFRERFAMEEDEITLQHFGLGQWMRNFWGLWSGSRLASYFHELGIEHPDDMSSIILTSYWRYLNAESIHLDEQVTEHQEYWRTHQTPEDRAFAECPDGVSLRGGVGHPSSDLPGFTHVGVCEADGTWWAYHADHGWFRPDRELIDHFGDR
jgi:hypothetical protein